MHTSIESMIGHTMKSVSGDYGDDVMQFTSEDGTEFRFFHRQNCCENVEIEDVVGELSDLVGSPILVAEECNSESAPDPECYGSFTWTFYRFATVKGTVTVRWLGTSNGHYSEAVHFEVVKPKNIN